MATTMQQLFREFVALNRRYLAGELPAADRQRWDDLVEVIDAELARYGARAAGLRRRRRGARVPLQVPVELLSAAEVGAGETTDLSCDGCGLHSRCELRAGAEVELTLRLPDGHGTLHPAGRVRWAAPDRLGAGWQAGVAFSVGDWERARLASCVLGAVTARLVAAA